MVDGQSNGGGQAVQIIVAVVTEHAPLLLTNGIGVRLKMPEWKIETVAGLATGQDINSRASAARNMEY